MNLSNRLHFFLLICLIAASFWFAGGTLIGILLLMLMVISGKYVFKQGSIRTYSLTVPMLVYLTWLFVVAYMSDLPYSQLVTIPVLASLPVVYFIATQADILEHSWRRICAMLFVLAVCFSIWGIAQVALQVGYGHAQGPFYDRNVFAALLNLIWFPTIYLFIKNKDVNNQKVNVFIGLGLFVISTAFFATKSRGAIGAWFLLMPILLWAVYQYTQSKQKLVVILLIILSAFTASAVLLDSSISERSFNLATDDSTNIRLLLWQATIKIAQTHPLFGTGWGTFVNFYPQLRDPLEYSSAGYYAHNDYLQFAAEGGVISTLILLAILYFVLILLIKSLKNCKRDNQIESSLLLLGVLALFMQAMVNYIFYFAFMNIFVALFLSRVSGLTSSFDRVVLPYTGFIRPAIKKLIAGVILFLLAFPLIVDLVALGFFSRSQPLLKSVNIVAPNANAYNIAHILSALRPTGYVAQMYILKVNELYLTQEAHFLNLSAEERYELLSSTLALFEKLRAETALNAKLGNREASLLIKHQALYDSKKAPLEKSAYVRAKNLLEVSVQTNPANSEAVILLARLEHNMGLNSEALTTLAQYGQNAIKPAHKLLIKIEQLRYIAPASMQTQLNEYESVVNEHSILKEESSSELTKQLEIYQPLGVEIDRLLKQYSQD